MEKRSWHIYLKNTETINTRMEENLKASFFFTDFEMERNQLVPLKPRSL